MGATGVSGGECRSIGRPREAVRPPARRPRTGLVLGAGGVVGAAWMTGALHAVQQRLDVAVGDADLIVGTSAGSVLAAALRCGVTLDEMTALQRGDAVPVLREAGVLDLDEGPLPPRPRLRAGSPRLMLTTLRAPRTIHPGVGVSAWLPRGRGRHEALHTTVAALDTAVAARRDPAWTPGSWADGRTWIVAVDYDTGRRVMFGREGAPRVPLADAVVASCSIPGWYEPAVIDGHHYVDGGVRSSTSLRSLAQAAWTRCTCSRRWPACSPTGRPGPPSGWNAGCGGGSPAPCSARPWCCGPPASGSRCSPPARRTWPPWAST